MQKVNLSLNGIPGTLWEIKRQEQIHWYLGYRQAILIVNSLGKTLKEAILTQKKATLALEQKKKLLVDKVGVELEILILENEIADDALEEQKQLFRDTETEYQTALVEKTRIETEHPEILLKDYKTLQTEYALDAFRGKLARHVAIATYSSHRALPESASEVIYDMMAFSVEEQQDFHQKLSSKMFELLLSPSKVVQSFPDALTDLRVNQIDGGFNELISGGS